MRTFVRNAVIAAFALVMMLISGRKSRSRRLKAAGMTLIAAGPFVLGVLIVIDLISPDNSIISGWKSSSQFFLLFLLFYANTTLFGLFLHATGRSLR